MVKSGIVISINSNSGIIQMQNKNRTEYFFSINECCEGELPILYSTVTFVKDQDFKSTNVAMLVKRSNVFKNIA